MTILNGRVPENISFDYIRFPGIGPLTKKSMVKGFSMIADAFSNNFKKSFKSLNRLELFHAGIKFSLISKNENYYNSNPIGEFYIDDGVKKDIFSCKEKGLYFLVYSKKYKQIIDITRFISVDGDDKTIITHHFKR